ncbi:hypothetical protein MF451_003754 [Salmonella enterica subsp. enterica serovar Saintpaul]|nr:hypothetical protein [Salmonella enterica subsp. enterica serovar Saintpaul]
MNLRSFIDQYFGGNVQLFREAVGVSPKTAYRWVSGGAVVAGGKICLPARDLPSLPPVPPNEQRETFEAMMRVHRPDADLSSVDGFYIDKQVQNIFAGWYMAQCAFTTEALGRR